MTRRRVSNPLALAVLGCLTEKPMHPYEISTTLRTRGKEQSIKLNYGSLYTVVNNLARHGLIEAMGAGREGRRPERTVYQITEAGRKELGDWMTELVAVPVKEYPQFEAALAELAWVRGLVAEFEDRTFPGLDGWQHVHDTHEWPAEFGPVPPEWAGPDRGPGNEEHRAREEGAATNQPE